MARATNPTMQIAKDKAIVLSLLANPGWDGCQSSQTRPMNDRWREITDWVREGGSAAIFNAEAEHTGGGVLAACHCLRDAFEEVKRLAILEEDWNDEGAPVIDRGCILRAQRFIQWIASLTKEESLPDDCAPAVFPTIDGGITLYWKTKGRQTSVTFRPNQALIEISTRPPGGPTVRSWATTEDAGANALQVMREAA